MGMSRSAEAIERMNEKRFATLRSKREANIGSTVDNPGTKREAEGVGYFYRGEQRFRVIGSAVSGGVLAVYLEAVEGNGRCSIRWNGTKWVGAGGGREHRNTTFRAA